jgi:antitoxin component YwqK of YwqJK toxin-antitoxin module
MEIPNNLRLVEQEIRYICLDNVIESFYLDVNNKKQGLSKKVYNGITLEECNYVDDVLHGESKRYSLEGVIKFMTNYVNDMKVKYTTYYDNGNIEKEINYKYYPDYSYSLMEGLYVDYFYSGKTRRIRNYIKDRLVGISKVFYDNPENTISKETCERINDQQERYDKEYYENGALKIHTIYNIEDYRKIVKYYKETGVIKQTRKFSSMESDNPTEDIIYHHNGNVKSVKVYDKRRYVLISQKDYYSDGIIHKTMEYNSQGQRHGVFDFYHPNGNLLSRKTYENNVQV